MSANYLTHIKPPEDSGLSDEQIATVLRATTLRAIPRKQAVAYLFENDIDLQDENGVYYGRLKSTLIEDLSQVLGSQEAAVKAGLRRFLGYVRSQDFEGLQLQTSAEGPPAIALLTALVAINTATSGQLGVTQAEVDGFLALGGGIVDPDATADSVAAERAAYQAQQQLIQRRNRLHAAVDVTVNSGADLPALQTAIAAAWENQPAPSSSQEEDPFHLQIGLGNNA